MISSLPPLPIRPRRAQNHKTTGLGAQQTTTWYLYSDEGLVEEINAAGQTTKSYGWQADSGWGTAQLWQTEHNSSAQGQAQTQTHWLHTDHLERPLVASDSSGAATWQALTESFGQTWVHSTNRTEVNIRLPGQYWDAESGRHYNQQRYYDPLGLYDGINTYGCAYQNPLNYSDPTGEAVPAIVWSYPRCVAKCKVSDALRAAIQSECDPRTLGDCALECLNPLNWLENKFNKAIPKPAKGKGSVAPAQRDKKRVWSKEENKKILRNKIINVCSAKNI